MQRSFDKIERLFGFIEILKKFNFFESKETAIPLVSNPGTDNKALDEMVAQVYQQIC